MPIISPKPAAVSRLGACTKISVSANIAAGDVVWMVFFVPRIIKGAPAEVKPSTDAAVGTEINLK
ncbi:hypothetical protein D3C86_2062040 [compost metagenome]